MFRSKHVSKIRKRNNQTKPAEVILRYSVGRVMSWFKEIQGSEVRLALTYSVYCFELLCICRNMPE